MVLETYPRSDTVKVQWGKDFDPFDSGTLKHPRLKDSIFSHPFELPNKGIAQVDLSEVPSISEELFDEEHRQIKVTEGRLVLEGPLPKSVYQFSVIVSYDSSHIDTPSMICTLSFDDQQLVSSYDIDKSADTSKFGNGMFSLWRHKETKEEKPFSIIIPDLSAIIGQGKMKLQFEESPVDQ